MSHMNITMQKTRRTWVIPLVGSLLQSTNAAYGAECGETRVGERYCGATQIWNPGTQEWEDYGGTIKETTYECVEVDKWAEHASSQEVGSCVPGEFPDVSVHIGSCDCQYNDGMP